MCPLRPGLWERYRCGTGIDADVDVDTTVDSCDSRSTLSPTVVMVVSEPASLGRLSHAAYGGGGRLLSDAWDCKEVFVAEVRREYAWY